MQENKSLAQTAKYMIYGIIGLTVVFLVVGLVVIHVIYPFEKPLPFALGLFAGSLVSVFKVYLLQRSILKSVDREESAAQNYATMQFLLRHGITLVFLVAIIFFRTIFGLFGGILGILTLQFSAYIANFMMNRQEKENTEE